MVRKRDKCSTDKSSRLLNVLGRYARDIASVMVLGGLVGGSVSYFAKAEDLAQAKKEMNLKYDQVNKVVAERIGQLALEYKAGRWEDRKAQVARELLVLRSQQETPAIRAQIAALQAEMNELAAKLQSVEERRMK